MDVIIPKPDEWTYSVVKEAAAPTKIGRRSFFNYFDLGVTGSTNGWMRAEIIKPKPHESKPTGFHYHECEAQFVYLMEGWVKMEFADGATHILEPGDAMFIPGGYVHNEAQTSEEFKALELTVPALIGTVPVETPDSFK